MGRIAITSSPDVRRAAERSPQPPRRAHPRLPLLAGALCLAVLAQLARPSLARACTPPPNYRPSTIEERTRGADLVVVGEVIATTEPTPPVWTYAARVLVKRSLKGNLSDEEVVDIHRYGPSGLCYSDVRVGLVALLFVDRDPDGGLHAHYEQQIDAVAGASESNVLRVLMALGEADRILLPAALRP